MSKYGRITAENKEIPEDEPLFIVRGKDRLAPALIEKYANLAEDYGASEEFVNEIWSLYWEMKDWQHAHPDRIKVPD